MLDIYPLEVGQVRVYDVYTMYTDMSSETQFGEWSGTVVETITEVRQENGAWVFVASIPDRPSGWVGEVEFQDETRKYQVYSDHIEGVGFVWNRRLINWPLQVGDGWDFLTGERVSDTSSGYTWWVTNMAEKDIFGLKTNCYEFSFVTNPDSTIIEFCEGVGIVSEYYRHIGSPGIISWQLQSIENP